MSKYNLTEILNESFDSLAKKLDKQKGIDKDEAAKIAGSIAAKKMKGAGKGPTAKQKARMKEGEVDESFDSLAKKLDKQKGIDKEDAAKIAGSIAAKKMKGAGSGPTAKQKARVKEEEVSDVEQVFDIIYAAGGKDKASDFMDAIGEEFGIDFEYGRVNEQSKPINELAPDVRNRIDGLINRRFKYDFLMDFIKIYADITQDDPFDSEDILEYLEEVMRRKLKEQDMYMDNFTPDDMKKSIKEDEEEEEEIIQYAPFVEGETFLRKRKFIDKTLDTADPLSRKQQRNFDKFNQETKIFGDLLIEGNFITNGLYGEGSSGVGIYPAGKTSQTAPFIFMDPQVLRGLKRDGIGYGKIPKIDRTRVYPPAVEFVPNEEYKMLLLDSGRYAIFRPSKFANYRSDALQKTIKFFSTNTDEVNEIV